MFDEHGVQLLYISFELNFLYKEWMCVLYYMSWLIRVIAANLINMENLKKSRLRKAIKTIIIERKYHLVLYYLNIVNLGFFGLRTVFHTQFTRSTAYSYTVALLGCLLMFYDTFEIILLSKTASLIKKTSKKRTIGIKGNKKEEEKKDIEIRKSIIDKKPSHLLSNKIIINDNETTGKQMTIMKNKPQNQQSINNLELVIKRLKRNLEIEGSVTEDMRRGLDLSRNKNLLLSNFSFYLKILAYQLILVGLPFL